MNEEHIQIVALQICNAIDEKILLLGERDDEIVSEVENDTQSFELVEAADDEGEIQSHDLQLDIELVQESSDEVNLNQQEEHNYTTLELNAKRFL